ncbi:hypothetical protein BJ322DRAFT_1017439 [Thelephora terrestris]|uniref:SHSP domain-containing protein n=1 Tax=Thelephora terrestris TaxID=56493 RepID=A0A9P6HQP8_9AGAM|nr:hypothetical protein BJ322DRAFT_1017439 [Thelephora terrestris]
MPAPKPRLQWEGLESFPCDSFSQTPQTIPPREDHPLPASSSSLSSEEDDYLPSTPPDSHVSLDSVWESVRKAKERSMAAQPSKIKSLERHRGSPTPPQLQARTSEPYQPHKQPTKLQKGKSYVKYRDSADGLTVTAIFDLPRVKKDDMHVSFQGNRLVVSWRTVKITEREEPLDADDLGSGTRILRELEHKKYSRTIPLPDGTRFEQIRAARDGRHLVLTYPNISTSRAGPIVHDGL